MNKLERTTIAIACIIIALCPAAQICMLICKWVAPTAISWGCALIPTFAFGASVIFGGIIVFVAATRRGDI